MSRRIPLCVSSRGRTFYLMMIFYLTTPRDDNSLTVIFSEMRNEKNYIGGDSLREKFVFEGGEKKKLVPLRTCDYDENPSQTAGVRRSRRV